MASSKEEVLVAEPIRLRRYTWALVFWWTVAIVIVLVWNFFDKRHEAMAIARSEAAGAWKKEAAVYRWASSMGGVYVPISPQTPPDPNLGHHRDRDISTPSGRKLTLVSPPMLMRQVHRITRRWHGYRGHITSLQPIDPQNAPDPWEEAALQAFARGEPEADSEASIGGARYLRYMRPLVIEKACLVCHAEQGYQVGDLRGGLSIAVPMASVWSTQLPSLLHRLIGYGGMWVLGLLGIAFLSRHLKRQISKRQEAEEKLRQAYEVLEQRVAERTAELARANAELQGEIADRRQAEQWLLESEQRFRGYFEQGVVGMAILSPQREWVEVNRRLCQILGYTADELFLKPWSELTHPDDRAAEEEQFQQLLASVMKRFVLDKRLVRKDRRPVEVRLTAQSMRKPDGSVDCLLVLVQEMGRRPTA